MCTLSWWRRDGRCSVRFNRDERIGRPEAEAPRLRTEGSLSLLSPRDPEGGGTWICVDATGTTHCLLNYYDAETAPPPKAPVASRGRLPLLAAAAPGGSLADRFPTRDLDHYPPFHLLRIPRIAPIEHLCWDGRDAFSGPDHPDLGQWTTSGWNPAEVVAFRARLFRELLAPQGPSEEVLDRFHRHRSTEQTAFGPWMSRSDARTRSLSTLRIGDGNIDFAYTPLSSENEADILSASMPLTASPSP